MSDQTDARLLQRIAAAKADRDRHAPWMNEILRLAMPTYRRVGERGDSVETKAQEQDDLFDTTLQEVREDFSSDMLSTFTPQHERWVSFEPSVSLTEGERRFIGSELKRIEDEVFGEIERSNYYEAAQECFAFWGVAAMAVAVSDMGALNPLHFQPIEIADLLMERGPDGTVTGRWREMNLCARDLPMLWPGVFPVPARGEANKKHAVIEGCDRDMSRPGEERWIYRILVDGKQKYARTYKGAGSCPIITCRFMHQSDSAWGPGPMHKAVPPARVLDELAYLNLKALQRTVDPITSYEEDGVTNPEAGFDAGTWVPRAAGSKPPEALLPEVRFDALIWNADELRQRIRRAVYQDRPDQPGKTPPTATQWIDERTWQTRRRELPRDRCVREWVLPIIERVMWIKQQRGELPEIRLKDGRLVTVRPVSPLSKAKDLEDVQVTQQVVGIAQAIANVAQVVPSIDVRGSLANVQRTLKERHLVLLSDDQVAAAQALATQDAPVDDAASAAALAVGGGDVA